jgi:hypothetical protein
MLCRRSALRCAAAGILALALAQAPAFGATPPPDQQEFCTLVGQWRASAAVPDPAQHQHAVQAAGAAAIAFVEQHRGIDWVGTIGRLRVAEHGDAAGEVEVCPSAWVGGLSPEGGLDSDTWAEPETHVFNRLHAAKQGQQAEIRAALIGVYDKHADFPAKIWLRARLIDLTVLPE